MNALVLFLFSLSALTAQAGEYSRILHGKGFVFSFEEPNGQWECECTGAIPESLGANAVLVPKGKSAQDPTVALIRVRLNQQEASSFGGDLETSIAHYKKQSPKIVFSDVEATHPTYRVRAKMAEEPGVFTEYFAYVYPPLATKNAFSVAMNIQKRRATADELAAFRTIVKSLQWITHNEQSFIKAAHGKGVAK